VRHPAQSGATILGNLNKRPPDVERALRCIDVPWSAFSMLENLVDLDGNVV
jgi:hypothetical protein